MLFSFQTFYRRLKGFELSFDVGVKFSVKWKVLFIQTKIIFLLLLVESYGQSTTILGSLSPFPFNNTGVFVPKAATPLMV